MDEKTALQQSLSPDPLFQLLAYGGALAVVLIVVLMISRQK